MALRFPRGSLFTLNRWRLLVDELSWQYWYCVVAPFCLPHLHSLVDFFENHLISSSIKNTSQTLQQFFWKEKRCSAAWFRQNCCIDNHMFFPNSNRYASYFTRLQNPRVPKTEFINFFPPSHNETLLIQPRLKQWQHIITDQRTATCRVGNCVRIQGCCLVRLGKNWLRPLMNCAQYFMFKKSQLSIWIHHLSRGT